MTNNKLYKLFSILFSLTILLGCGNSDTSQLIDKALEAEHRTPSYVERDKYRHPKETLLFFGLNPEQSVVEITPGYGWYTEILAPLMRNKGQYSYASLELHEKINPYFVKLERAFKEKMEKILIFTTNSVGFILIQNNLNLLRMALLIWFLHLETYIIGRKQDQLKRCLLVLQKHLSLEEFLAL